MDRVLRINPDYGLSERILLWKALAERIHRASKKVQQRIIAVSAIKIEHSIVLIMVVLVVLGADNVHAESNLVLTAQDIDIVSFLVIGDIKRPQRPGPTPDIEATIVDRELQKIRGALIDVLDSEGSRIDAVGIRATVIPPPPNREMERVHDGRTKL